MKASGKPPEKNTSEWKRNEKIINDTPALRELRDISEGFTPGRGSAGGWTPSQAYKDNFDAIFRKDKKDSADE
jgi:hypothetical protein